MKILVLADVTDASGKQHEAIPFALTDASLLTGGKPQFLPHEEHEYLLFPCAALQLQNTGRKIAPRFVHRYVEKMGAAALLVDMTELTACRKLGLPYTRAVSFDFNVARGTMLPFTPEEFEALSLEYGIGSEKRRWTTENEGKTWRDSLALLSRDYTFRTGDLVLPYLGKPVAVKVDTHVRAGIFDRENNLATNIILEYNIK